MKTSRVYGYTRVSTEEQARGGVSLEMQAERIRAYCDSQGWTLARVFEDAGHSGTSLRRPALQELLSKLDGIDAVLVYRVDRLSRKQRHVLVLLEESLEPRGVGFKSVTEPFDTTTPMGKAFLGMLAVFSQLERDTITARIRDALRHKQAQGEHVGAAPFGYARNGHGLKPIPEELAVVGEMQRRRAGGATLREIAAWLVEHKVPTRRGGRWAPGNVRYVLSNPRYQYQACGEGPERRSPR